MKLRAFCVRDEKAEAFLPPFFLHAIGQAMRAFADSVNDPAHQFGKHPEDYSLFEIGSFDDALGRFEPFESPRCVTIGVDVKRSE